MYDTLLGALAFSNEQNKTFTFMEVIFCGGRKKIPKQHKGTRKDGVINGGILTFG